MVVGSKVKRFSGYLCLNSTKNSKTAIFAVLYHFITIPQENGQLLPISLGEGLYLKQFLIIMKKINLFSSKTINKVLYVPTLQTAMHILQRLLRRISSLFRHLLFWDCLYRCLAKLFASSSESMPLFHSTFVR